MTSVRESFSASWQSVPMYGGGRRLTSEVQSLLFKRDKWTPSQVKKWVKRHPEFQMKKLDVTNNYIRVRQRAPKGFKIYRTVTFSDQKGIKAVLGLRAA